MKRILLILLVSLSVLPTRAGDIPVFRRYAWDHAGARLQESDDMREVNIIQFGADSSGHKSNHHAYLQALNNIKTEGGIIFFPSGVYLFHEPIYVPSNVVLKGNGESTQLVFRLNENQHGINFNGALSSEKINLHVSASKGSKQLVINENHQIAVGDFLKITIKDSDLASSSWAKNSIGQIVEIEGVNNNVLFLKSALRIGFEKESATILKMLPVSGSGIQCLRIYREDTTTSLTSNIRFNNATHCYINSIESEYCNFAHVEISNSSNISVSGSYFNKGHDYGEGGRAYGVLVQFTSGECLIENNIYSKLRHSMLLQAGANGNVLSYNYSVNPYWEQGGFPDDAAGDLVLHGNYPFANLFEGNVVQNVVIDYSHGKNGFHNTIYRNTVERYGLFINPDAGDSLNIVGNDIVSKQFLHGNYILYGVGHFENYNLVKGVASPSGSVKLQEQSLYSVDVKHLITDETGELYLKAQKRFLSGKLIECKVTPGDSTDSTITSIRKPDLVWSIHPNPARDYINIESNTNRFKVSLLNLNGQTVVPTTTADRLNTSLVPRGVYVVKLVKDGRSTYQKVLIQ